ncbi:MAG: substrate-binding domain-containing protein [Chloroflexota bacterium]
MDSSHSVITAQSHAKPSALTLGILISSTDDPFENALLRGFSDAVRKAGANWMCFTSGAIRSYHGFESQRNMLYNLVNMQVVDGLVVSGTLGHGVSHAELRTFCLNYQPLPVVTVAVDLEGIPCVLNNSYQGITDVVTHLLDVHGHRKLAFIRGPVGHQEADERFRAFRDVMLAHGCSEDDSEGCVSVGDYTIESGREAMQALLSGNKKFEAVVSANDSMALGALEVLRSNGYNVPQDIAVTGFDDSEDGRHNIPPLTTIRQSVYDMGWQAGYMLLAKLRQENVPETIVVSPALVIRQSCGCSNQELQNAAYQNEIRSDTGLDLPDLRKITCDAMTRSVPNNLVDTYTAWTDELFTAFWDDLQDAEVGGTFIKKLEEVVLQGFTLPGADDLWHDMLSSMRRVVLQNVSNEALVQKAEMLWQQARVVISAETRKYEAYSRLHVEKRSVILREISEMLMSSHSLADVLDVVGLEFPRLGIKAFYLSLFENVKQSIEWSRLILAYDSRGRLALTPGEVRFVSRQLVPGNMLSRTGPYGLVAEALYSKEEKLGFMLLDVDAAESVVCGALRGLLSSALQGVILNEQREQAEGQLRHYQKNLEQLVDARTLELRQINQQLEQEVAEHQRTQSERERLIQELESKNAELERFAYTVSHDLKAPLITIKGFLGFVREDALAGNLVRLEADIHRIGEAADKMHALLNDLLELSRIGRMMNNPEPVPFEALVQDAIELTDGRLQEHGIQVQVASGLPVVQGDRQRLLEVVQNLLDNAAKFMGTQSKPQIEIGVQGSENNMPVIYVRDNGIGIAPQYHERIFGLFNRLDQKVEGTGVGLTLVKRIIEFHGGRIWVESAVGQGATFFFTLPRSNDPKINQDESP